MTRRTLSKYFRTLLNKDPSRKAIPPAKKELKTLVYNGVEMLVPHDPGQIISPKKEYMRRKKELEARRNHNDNV